MRFADLSDYADADTRKLDFRTVSAMLPHTPEDVVRQFYADHGANPDFIAQYGELDVSGLVWSKDRLSGSELVAASVYPGFERWFLSVKRRLDSFSEKGWRAVDRRPGVAEHWEKFGTWREPPIFLAPGTFQGQSDGLHLVEGHTRLGTLAGAVGRGLLEGRNLHEAWVGRRADR